MAAVKAFNFKESPEWECLAALSAETDFDAIALVPEGIFEQGDKFSAVARVSVDLVFDESGERFPESFSATVKGHFIEKGDIGAEVDAVDVDVDLDDDL